jgi:DNA (cytosine-5)-methyltransferase 1
MELTALDLFSGAGGASLGLLNVDAVDLQGAVDIDEEALASYNRNLPVKAVKANLKKTTLSEITDSHYDFQPRDIDLIVGCPPCQEFSSLQDTTPDPELRKKPKDNLLSAYLDRILEASPRVVLFENVPGLTQGNDKQYLEDFLSFLRKAGYGVKYDVYNMANFGVPQKRDRAIAFAVRGAPSNELTLPTPTHAPPEGAQESQRHPWRTVEEDIGDLPALESGESKEDQYNGHRARNHKPDTIERIKAVPENGDRRDLPPEHQLDCHKNLKNESSAGNIYGRMNWRSPAPTLTGRCLSPSSGRFLHPEQDRAISPREAARLMTFPDWYKLPEKNSVAETVLGNAIPPRFFTVSVEQFLTQNRELIVQSRRNQTKGVS